MRCGDIGAFDVVGLSIAFAVQKPCWVSQELGPFVHSRPKKARVMGSGKCVRPDEKATLSIAIF